MATKGKKVVRKRREKKNIERGAAHIRSSFNNTIVSMTAMHFLRAARALLASAAAESPLRLQRRWLLRQRQRLLWSMASKLLKYT